MRKSFALKGSALYLQRIIKEKCLVSFDKRKSLQIFFFYSFFSFFFFFFHLCQCVLFHQFLLLIYAQEKCKSILQSKTLCCSSIFSFANNIVIFDVTDCSLVSIISCCLNSILVLNSEFLVLIPRNSLLQTLYLQEYT